MRCPLKRPISPFKITRANPRFIFEAISPDVHKGNRPLPKFVRALEMFLLSMSWLLEMGEKRRGKCSIACRACLWAMGNAMPAALAAAPPTPTANKRRRGGVGHILDKIWKLLEIIRLTYAYIQD